MLRLVHQGDRHELRSDFTEGASDCKLLRSANPLTHEVQRASEAKGKRPTYTGDSSINSRWMVISSLAMCLKEKYAHAEPNTSKRNMGMPSQILMENNEHASMTAICLIATHMRPRITENRFEVSAIVRRN